MATAVDRRQVRGPAVTALVSLALLGTGLSPSPAAESPPSGVRAHPDPVRAAAGPGWRLATTETHVAGVYADVPDTTGGGIQHQGSVNLPGWTQLDLVVSGRRFASTDASDYRQ